MSKNVSRGILGKKIGMTQIFDSEGRSIAVTVIEAGPCVVLQKKTVATDGYDAVQLGFDPKKEFRTNRPMKGHFAKAKAKPVKFIKEIRTSNLDDIAVGQEIKVDIFSEGDVVDVTGTSLGKGYTGVIKRYGFGRGPMSHGSKYHRRVGSLAATGVGRVFKGRKMPGRVGNERVTVKSLKVVDIKPERNLLLVKGSVPGRRGQYVVVNKATTV